MQPLGAVVAEGRLDVEVYSEGAFNQIAKVPDNVVRVFLHEALQPTHAFELVKVLLELGVEVGEYVQVLLKHGYLAVHTLLRSYHTCLLKLSVFLRKPLSETRNFILYVSNDIFLLLFDKFSDILLKSVFLLSDQVTKMVKHSIHQIWQRFQVLLRLLFPFLQLLLVIMIFLPEVRDLFQAFADLVLFALVRVRGKHADAQYVCYLVYLVLVKGLGVPSFLHLLLLHVLRNALPAERPLLVKEDGLWEVDLAQVIGYLRPACRGSLLIKALLG